MSLAETAGNLLERLVRVLDKPEYLFRPSQLLRRLRLAATTPRGRSVARLPWGRRIVVDSSEMIGSAILRLGVYDLVVTEALWRLVDSGEVALDVGANIGVMSSALAQRVGPDGSVHAFEPHPRICETLRENVGRWRDGVITVHEVAVSDRTGEAALFVPSDFDTNAGTASLSDARAGSTAITVRISTLDDLLPEEARPSVAKLDVEGHEIDLLRGAPRSLSTLRDIVFEDHGDYPSALTTALESQGFVILRLERSPFRPLLSDPRVRPRPSFDAPSLLATRDTARARDRFAVRGWACLRGDV
jgi:FkbM family methyltransferase